MSRSKYFEVPGGPKLHYLEVGRGDSLILLPGWSQTAAMFQHQLDGLSDCRRVIALDHRGHGESEDVEHGYRVSRLAMDLRSFILSQDHDQITLLGHSMGAAVIFAYIELFGSDGISKIILDDQPSALTLSEKESEQALAEAGAIFSFKHLGAVCTALRWGNAEETTRKMLQDMLSSSLFAEQGNRLLRENLKLLRQSAAALLWDCALNDWRSLIPQIDVPVLVIGGKASLVPWQSQQWIHHQIKGSVCEILDEEQGGYHFSFLERPDIFNTIVEDFLGKKT